MHQPAYKNTPLYAGQYGTTIRPCFLLSAWSDDAGFQQRTRGGKGYTVSVSYRWEWCDIFPGALEISLDSGNDIWLRFLFLWTLQGDFNTVINMIKRLNCLLLRILLILHSNKATLTWQRSNEMVHRYIVTRFFFRATDNSHLARVFLLKLFYLINLATPLWTCHSFQGICLNFFKMWNWKKYMHPITVGIQF